ncbi:hypothetical protein GCM10027418_28870 [Mariniluteicoccus endophyticus]
MVDQPPQTGHAEIDAALQRLADLDELDLASHHERLASAHEVLHAALDEATRPRG